MIQIYDGMIKKSSDLCQEGWFGDLRWRMLIPLTQTNGNKQLTSKRQNPVFFTEVRGLFYHTPKHTLPQGLIQSRVYAFLILL